MSVKFSLRIFKIHLVAAIKPTFIQYTPSIYEHEFESRRTNMKILSVYFTLVKVPYFIYKKK